MNLSEALVSYNQVRSPEIPVSVAIPDEDTQYKRYLKYVEDLRKKSKSSKKSSETTDDTQQSSGWEGWTLDSEYNVQPWWYISDKSTVPELVKKEIENSENPKSSETSTPENPIVINPDNVKRAKKIKRKKVRSSKDFIPYEYSRKMGTISPTIFNYEFQSDITHQQGLRPDRFKQWMNYFGEFGLNTNQQFALSIMLQDECALTPKGAVEKSELAGKSKNVKGGWADAGEGTVGFTHWNTKERYIKMFNNDPRRKGPKLPDNKKEYSNPSARHISDLSDSDHALITYLFYKDILDNTDSNNFEELLGKCYLKKAGDAHYKDVKDVGIRSFMRATDYQHTHKELGYMKSAETNKWERNLRDAEYYISALNLNYNGKSLS